MYNFVSHKRAYFIFFASKLYIAFFKERISKKQITAFCKYDFIENRINFSDLIQGNKFKNLTKFNSNLFFFPTHCVNSFFIEQDNFENRYVLISHNSDACVTDFLRDKNKVKAHEHADMRNMPENCIMWYAQNVEVVNDRIIPIPIGFPNNEFYENNFQKIKEAKHKKRNIINLVYLNVNVKNNLLIRENLYSLFKKISFVTKVRGKYGLNFLGFVNDLRSHLFVLCPEGNGIDTHLMWEAIALDCIPIVQKSINNLFYRDKLPVCWVDNYNQACDINFLEKEYKRIIDMKLDLEIFHHSYWEESIKQVLAKLI